MEDIESTFNDFAMLPTKTIFLLRKAEGEPANFCVQASSVPGFANPVKKWATSLESTHTHGRKKSVWSNLLPLPL